MSESEQIEMLIEQAIKQEMPTPKEQANIRDLVYSKIPQIREKIFK